MSSSKARRESPFTPITRRWVVNYQTMNLTPNSNTRNPPRRSDIGAKTYTNDGGIRLAQYCAYDECHRRGINARMTALPNRPQPTNAIVCGARDTDAQKTNEIPTAARIPSSVKFIRVVLANWPITRIAWTGRHSANRLTPTSQTPKSITTTQPRWATEISIAVQTTITGMTLAKGRHRLGPNSEHAQSMTWPIITRPS